MYKLMYIINPPAVLEENKEFLKLKIKNHILNRPKLRLYDFHNEENADGIKEFTEQNVIQYKMWNIADFAYLGKLFRHFVCYRSLYLSIPGYTCRGGHTGKKIGHPWQRGSLKHSPLN